MTFMDSLRLLKTVNWIVLLPMLLVGYGVTVWIMRLIYGSAEAESRARWGEMFTLRTGPPMPGDYAYNLHWATLVGVVVFVIEVVLFHWLFPSVRLLYF